MPNCISLSTIDSQLSCQEQDNMGGIVPKLMWPLSKARETQMYYELAQMRDKRINAYVEDLEAKAQESEA